MTPPPKPAIEESRVMTANRNKPINVEKVGGHRLWGSYCQSAKYSDSINFINDSDITIILIKVRYKWWKTRSHVFWTLHWMWRSSIQSTIIKNK